MRTIENNKNPFEKINDADDRFTNSIVEWWLTHVMNMTMKLSVNAMTPGTIVQRASQKSLLLPMASGGILMSKISSVSAIANTPSQKHSIRALGFDSTTGFDPAVNACPCAALYTILFCKSLPKNPSFLV